MTEELCVRLNPGTAFHSCLLQDQIPEERFTAACYKIKSRKSVSQLPVTRSNPGGAFHSCLLYLKRKYRRRRSSIGGLILLLFINSTVNSCSQKVQLTIQKSVFSPERFSGRNRLAPSAPRRTRGFSGCSSTPCRFRFKEFQRKVFSYQHFISSCAGIGNVS